MMRIKTSFIFLSMLLLCASSAYCITAEEIITKIQTVYDSANDYTALFYQESEMGSAKRVQKGTGAVYFKKNGKMCWEYKEPMQQKIVSNGLKMWIYQPDINQVQEFDYKEIDMSKTANSFLNGIGKLKEDFNIKFEAEDIEGNFVLDLKPKEDKTGFKDMKMIVSSKNFNIIKSVTTDAFNNKNSISFKDIKFNTNIADNFFDFKVPEGVVVVAPPKQK